MTTANNSWRISDRSSAGCRRPSCTRRRCGGHRLDRGAARTLTSARSKPKRSSLRSQALTALERLAIYGHAYYARLLECLREEFPVLKHALGEELFDELRRRVSGAISLAELHALPPGTQLPALPGGDPARSGWRRYFAQRIGRTFSSTSPRSS